MRPEDNKIHETGNEGSTNNPTPDEIPLADEVIPFADPEGESETDDLPIPPTIPLPTKFSALDIIHPADIDDDDDYADIEIGNEAVTAIAPSIDVAPPKRTTTAHVVRRAPGPSAIMSASNVARLSEPQSR